MVGVLEHFPFNEFRAGQDSFLEAIVERFADSGYVFLEAPTGFGKSPVAVALGSFFGGAHVLTSTRQLQDQYAGSFPDIIKTVRGRGNFFCRQDKGLIPGSVPASRGKCITEGLQFCEYKPNAEAGADFAATSASRGPLFWPGEKHCGYWEQKVEAMNATIALHNYAYFLGETNSVGDFGKRPVLICDEAHNIEGQLMSYVGLVVDNAILRRCELEIHDKGEWARDYQHEIGTLLDRLRKLTLAELDPEQLEQLERLISKTYELQERIAVEPDNWVVVGGKEGLEFKPLRISNYTKSLLFNGGERVLMMSATILNSNLVRKWLGLGRSEVAEPLIVPAQVPPEQRSIHLRYVGSMSYHSRSATFPKIVAEVHKILNEHPDEKGIIHSVSYKNARELYRQLPQASQRRILFPEGAQHIPHVLERHMTSPGPTVILSPSMKEGVDLMEHLSRFQIILKVPFPYLGDPQVKHRMEQERVWYEWQTIVALIQTIGRSVRSTEDWAETYLLDGAFERLEDSSLIPDYIKHAYVRN